MKLSTKSRYGLRAMVELGKQSRGNKASVALQAIAREQKISLKYLENIFQVLRSANLVKSCRGPHGGYRLKKSPAIISVLDVVKSLEGPLAIVDCCNNRHRCPLEWKCLTVKYWRKVNKTIHDSMQNTSLADLISG